MSPSATSLEVNIRMSRPGGFATGGERALPVFRPVESGLEVRLQQLQRIVRRLELHPEGLEVRLQRRHGLPEKLELRLQRPEARLQRLRNHLQRLEFHLQRLEFRPQGREFHLQGREFHLQECEFCLQKRELRLRKPRNSAGPGRFAGTAPLQHRALCRL